MPKLSQQDKAKIIERAENGGHELAHTKFLREMKKDLSQLQNQFAVYCLKDDHFYKLAVLDHRGLRFELWGENKCRWISFPDGILFNYLDNEKFEELYQRYAKANQGGYVKSREKLLEWFKDYEGRISFLESYEEILIKRAEAKKD